MKYSTRFGNSTVLGYRFILIILSVVSLAVMHYERYVASDRGLFYDLYFFTTVTNYLVLIWLVLFFMWRDKEGKLDKLTGYVKGALTTYMTIVAVVYIVLISGDHDPIGLFILTNYLHHYIIPPLFVIDTLLFSSTRFEYKWILSWLLYPIVYLGYAMVIAWQTGYYVYFFLDLSKISMGEFFMWIGIMLSLFAVFGTLYVFLNRMLVKETD